MYRRSLKRPSIFNERRVHDFQKYSWILKGTVLEKWKGSRGWNLSILGVDKDLWEFYLMFLSLEIDIKRMIKIIPKCIYVKFRIDTMIRCSLYIMHYFIRTSTNSSAVSLSHVSCDQYTALSLAKVFGDIIILHCYWPKFLVT